MFLKIIDEGGPGLTHLFDCESVAYEFNDGHIIFSIRFKSGKDEDHRCQINGKDNVDVYFMSDNGKTIDTLHYGINNKKRD
jgi:hypothetical protein